MALVVWRALFLINFLLIGLGIVAFYNELNLPRGAEVYSVLCAFIAIGTILFNGHNQSSWYFWFTIVFFLTYQFGTVVGLFFLPTMESYIDYPTNFSNEITAKSEYLSYIVSGIGICLLACISKITLTSSKQRIWLDKLDSLRLKKIGQFLIIVSSPVVLVELVLQIKLVYQHGYAYFYTSAHKEAGSQVPLASVFTNLNKLGFLLLFASLPKEKVFNWYALLFLFISTLDALKGARTALVLPIIFIMWFKARYYKSMFVSLSSKVLIGVVGISFLYIVKYARASQAIEIETILPFIVFSISKAQHHLAVFIDNQQLFNSDNIYVLAPLIFPLKYFIHGSAIVGQSESAALLRGDLNHTMSSVLNKSAYLDGAGIGSAMLSEAMQYGVLVFIGVFSLGVLLYEYFFRLTNRVKILFILQPLVFMHVAFSARDTLFPNTWVYIKLFIMLLFIWVAYQMLPKKKA